MAWLPQAAVWHCLNTASTPRSLKEIVLALLVAEADLGIVVEGISTLPNQRKQGAHEYQTT